MRDGIGCAAWVALSVAALSASAHLQVMTRFGPGPGFFVRGLAIVMLSLAVIQALTLVVGHTRQRIHSQPTPENVAALLNVEEEDEPLNVDAGRGLRFIALAVALFAYGLLIEQLGFIVSTAGLSFAAMTLLGRPPARSALEAVIAVIVAYIAFGQLLGVNLPEATIPPLAALGL